MQIEEIDLAALAEKLDAALEGCPAEGFVRGRTVIRDWVVEHFNCSELAAEELVDTMIGRGFLRFSGNETGSASPDAWVVKVS